MLSFESPALALVPSFTFPDRNCGFQRIDTEPGRSESLGPMRRRGDHNNGAVANDKFADSVHHDEATNRRPAPARFDSKFGQPRIDLRFVCLVLELVNIAAITAVVSRYAREENNGTAIGAMRPLECLGDGERFVGQPNPVITRRRNLHFPIVLQPAPPATFANQNGRGEPTLDQH